MDWRLRGLIMGVAKSFTNNLVDLAKPKNLLGDGMMLLRKPSMLLEPDTLMTSIGAQKSLTTKAKEADASAERASQSRFIDKYGDAQGFRDRVNAGLQV